MTLRWLFLLFGYVASASMEYYYTPPSECNINPITPPYADQSGLMGAPYVTIIDCPLTEFCGYNNESFRVYFQNETTEQFESHWYGAGAPFCFTIRRGYITGGLFAPQSLPSPYFNSAQYHRTYTLESAVIAHDEHVNEGDSMTVDLLWTNVDMYQPPLVLVVSCLQDENDTLWVKDHYHPKGALYVSLVGTLCFLVDGVNRCIEPLWEESTDPAIRWVSPLLRYNETFKAIKQASAFVNEVLNISCDYPLAFAVEKFDYMRNDTLPQFELLPSTAMAVTDDLRPIRLI